MAFQITAIKDGKQYKAIPMKNGSIIRDGNGQPTGTYLSREEVSSAYEDADEMQIVGLSFGGRPAMFPKTGMNISYKIDELL